MQETIKQSAASRLLRLLQTGVQIDGNTLTSDALAAIFGVEATNKAGVYDGLSGLYDLIATARQDVGEQKALNQQLYTGALDAIEQTINAINLGKTWEQYRAQLSGGTIVALQFVAEQFDRLTDEVALEAKDLDELRGLLDKAVTEITASTVDAALKAILVEKLEDARRAILRYRFDGIDGIRRAGEAAVGAIVLAGRSAKTDAARGGVERFLDVATKIVDLVNKASPLLRLLRPAVQQVLGAGDPRPAAE